MDTRRTSKVLTLAAALLGTALALLSLDASALPIFARQTGQNCLSCHAGGQFPELTPYGRMFKMTGYTIGARTLPFAVMGVLSDARVANTDKDPDPAQTFAKNGAPMFATGSLFIAGKVTDNIGAFAQVTYDNYNGQAVGASGANDGKWLGHSAADNMDFRYADRLVDASRDLVFGVSLNNNPSVSDPWNTASAWMQYVPDSGFGRSHQFSDANTPFPGNSTGSNVAGVTAYAYLNKAFYAELGAYRTANRALSFMSAGTADADTTKLQGSNNPYWRLAYTHEWGPQNIMVGLSGMTAHVFDNTTVPSDSGAYNRVKTTGIDAQYQYLLDPHTITAQAVYQRQKTDLSPNSIAAFDPTFGGLLVDPPLDANGNPMPTPNTSNTVNIFRAKLSYIYRATYGGSVSYFNQTGTKDSAAMQGVWFDDLGNTADLRTATTGNLAGDPATRGMTFEAFWMPVQYVRIGAQYTAYNKFNGATDNYDGLGRNARDNNTLLFYVWGAY
ncbi:MAG TPA: hypothetical protein VF801_13330 [Rhodocyclaceae bacterium]